MRYRFLGAEGIEMNKIKSVMEIAFQLGKTKVEERISKSEKP